MTDNHLLLNRLAELMLEHEQHVLPVDLLFDDERIGDFVKSIQIDSPYQQMLLEGVLTESVLEEKLCVSFTVEGYFHHVLGEVVYLKAEGKTVKYLKTLFENNNLSGVKEGVERCLIKESSLNNLNRLFNLIDIASDRNEILEICAIPLANAFLSLTNNSKSIADDTSQILQQKIKGVLNQLFKSPTKNDWEVLQKTIDYLKQNQKNTLVANIFEIINDIIVPNNSVSLKLLVNSVEFIPNNKRNDSLNRISDLNLLIPDEIESADFYGALGNQFLKSNIVDKSKEYNKKALDIRLSKLGPEHHKVAMSFNNLGLISLQTNLIEDAIDYFLKSLNILLKTPEKNISDLAGSYNNLGIAYSSKGDNNLAIECYQNAMNILVKNKGSLHPETNGCLNNLAIESIILGKYDEAISCLERVIEVDKKTLGNENLSFSYSFQNLGEIYLNKNDLEKSKNYFEKSLEIKLNYLVENHPEIGGCYYNLGLVSSELGDFKQALDYFYKSLEINCLNEGDQELFRSIIFNNLGDGWSNLNEHNKATEYYYKAIEIKLKYHGEYHSEIAIIYKNLGITWSKIGNREKTYESFMQSAKINFKLYGEEHLETGMAYYNLGKYFWDNEQFNEAKKYLEKAHHIFYIFLGENHEYTLFIKGLLEKHYDI